LSCLWSSVYDLAQDAPCSCSACIERAGSRAARYFNRNGFSLGGFTA
jgi:hypothetical protein